MKDTESFRNQLAELVIMVRINILLVVGGELNCQVGEGSLVKRMVGKFGFGKKCRRREVWCFV